MNDQVQRAVDEAGFQLVRPETLGAEVVQGRGLVLVAHGAHGVDFEALVRPCFLEGGVDDVGLEEGEFGAARADVDGAGAGAGRGVGWGGMRAGV